MLSLLVLAATSKNVHVFVMDPSVLTHVLHRAITSPNGLLHWILPVTTLFEECKRAKEPICTWFYPEPSASFQDYDFGDLPDDSEYQFDEDDEDTTSDVSDDASSESDPDAADLEEPVSDADTRMQSPELERPSTLSPAELILHPVFPLYAFVRACHLSDSMRARRRRWELIRQFDGLWAAYRTHGWERDDFIPA